MDEKAVGDALAEFTNYCIDRWGNKDEVQLLREPERTLTPLFVRLLSKAGEKQRLVLMFDVFERTQATFSPWLMALLNFEYGELDTSVIFVVSGRDPLEQHWTELSDVLCRIPLEPFTLDETRQYLGRKNITDEQLVSQIHEDTGGLPVLVELLAATNPKPDAPLPDISKDAVERFLQWTPEDHRRTALLAAVPRQFNRDILTAALGSEAAGQFNWLTAQSYIRSSAERGCFYHEKVRDLMLRHLRNTSPSGLEATHTRLAEFFAAAQQQLGLADKVAYESDAWRRYEEERVYHAVSVRPDAALAVAVNAFLTAFRWHWSWSDHIAASCRQVAHEGRSERIYQCAETLSQLYSAYDKDEYQLGIKMLSVLEECEGLLPSARCALYARRSYICKMLSDYEQALSDAHLAIALDESYVWAIANRGDTYGLIGKYTESLADFDRAIALDEKYARAIVSRGHTYQRMGKFDEALANFDRAITLDDKNVCAICLRGQMNRIMDRYNQALQDLARAIELGANCAEAIANRGVTYQRLDKYDEALADFDRAIALDEKCAWAIAGRGETYRLMGKYEEALANFDRAIALDNKDACAICQRGRTKRETGRYDQALHDLTRAIELKAKCAEVIAHRGETYRLMGRYDEGIRDFGHAISLDNTDYFSIASRGEIHRRLGNYQGAIGDCSSAIGINNTDTFAFSRRAAAYLANGNSEAAQADIAKVLGLPSNDVHDYYNRATVFALRNEFDESVEMLRQAIQCDSVARLYARIDDLLDPIRHLPQFQELMQDDTLVNENLVNAK